jgi:hypothetical protein
MHETILTSGRDTVLVAIPFALMVFMTVFRLDEAIATPKRSLNGRRLGCGLDEYGEPVLRDPDGQVAKLRRSRKRIH